MLLAAAVLLRLAIAIALRLLPFRVWRHWLATAARMEDNGAIGDAKRIGRVIRAVEQSEQVAPVGTCLARALTGYCLLTWKRQPCRVCIGVAWESDRRLRSHAWLESGSQVLLGGDVKGLSPMPMKAASVVQE
jgi:hypothetical protein